MTTLDDFIKNSEKYISSPEAISLTGYTRSHIAYLARTKKIDAKLVDNLWYINTESLMDFVKEEESRKSARKSELAEKRRVEYQNGKKEATRKVYEDSLKKLLEKTFVVMVSFLFVLGIFNLEANNFVVSDSVNSIKEVASPASVYSAIRNLPENFGIGIYNTRTFVTGLFSKDGSTERAQTEAQPIPEGFVQTESIIDGIVSGDSVRPETSQPITNIIVTGISEEQLTKALDDRSKQIIEHVQAITNVNKQQIVNNYTTIAHTNRIDNLGSVTITGSTITNTAITSSNISGGTGSFTSLSVGGSATSTFTGNISTANLAVTGLASCDTIDTDANGYFTCGTDDSGGTSFGQAWEVNGNGLLAPTTTIALYLPSTLYASSSALFDGTITADNFIGTSTATSTLSGGLSATRLDTTATSTLVGLQVTGGFNIGTITGFLKATSGVVATALVDLASDITGILGVLNGGTGQSNIQANTILLGNGTSAIATTTAGTNGQVLALEGGIPVWIATTTLSTISGTLAVANGGTGATTLNNLITLGTHSTGNYLATLANAGGLTVANSGSETAAVTVALDLTNANSWTGLQSFANASSTLFSNTGTAYFGGTATSTFDSAGNLTLAGTLTVGGDSINEFAGTNLTVTANTLNVDDAFLINDGDDTTTGSITATEFIANDAAATSTFAGGLTVQTDALVVQDDSKFVGIGTTTPSDVLSVQGDVSFSEGTNYRSFYWDATNGRLGIGSTTPITAFEVVGSSVISGGLSLPSETSTDGLTIGANYRISKFNSPILQIYETTGAASSIVVGVIDDANGVFEAAGVGTGEGTGGGRFRLRTAADHDATIDAFDITASADDLIFADSSNARHYLKFKDLTEVIINETSKDLDFRVETDTDTHGFFVDAALNNVGIGTSSPYAKLSVVGDVVAASYFATTTATSTFAGAIDVTEVNATSTFAHGIDIATGCFAVNGTCLGGGGSGTVTSIDVSGGTTGLTYSGGPITTSGTITMTGTLVETNGGTGQSTYSTGDILYSDGSNSLTKLAAGANGEVLKLAAGVPTWSTDLTSGGGGGSSFWATTTNDQAVHPADSTDIVIIGATATTTHNEILQVSGSSFFSGNIFASSSLRVDNSVLGNIFTASSTSATSTFPRADFTTALRLGTDYITDLTGTGLTMSGSTLTTTLGTAIVTGEITDGTILEGDLDADVAAVDGDFLTYDSTGTNFTWRSASETLSDIGAEGTLSNEAGLYAALSDVTQFWEAGDALSSGSISSGFGNIDIGASTFDTSGAVGIGNTTVTGTLGVSGLTSLINASSTLFSNTGTAYFGGTATSTFDSAGNLTLIGNLVISGDTINDFAGTGLTVTGNALTTTLGTAIVTGEITDGTILEGDLDADVSAVDGDFLTYDSTGTNFTWRSASETLSDIGAEGTLSNEAGLYAALSDVTQFWEAGDALSSGSISSGFGNIDIGASTFDTTGTITAEDAEFGGGQIAIGGQQSAFFTSVASAHIYTTASGGSDPFDESNNLIFQTRSSANRDMQFVTGSTPASRLTILGTGNVGIGTTTPWTNLHVVKADVGESWTPNAGTVGIFENSGSSYIDILGSSGSQSELWFGDESDENRGRIRYDHTDDSLEFWTDNSERIHISSTGNLGIGTSTPGNTLVLEESSGTADLKLQAGSATYYTTFSQPVSESGFQIDVGPTTILQAGGFNDADYLNLGVLGFANAFTIDTSGNVGIGSTTPAAALGVTGGIYTTGGVIVGGGTGKLTAGTIDPVYTIGDTQYSTYVSGMIGQKEETTGVVMINVPAVDANGNEGYVYEIDFDEQEIASDLWLFAKASSIKKHIDRLVVLLTPEGEADVWYVIDEAENKVIFLSDTPTTVSYRFTSPRFDTDTWTNFNNDGVLGFEVPEFDETIYFENENVTFSFESATTNVTESIIQFFVTIGGTIVSDVLYLGELVVDLLRVDSLVALVIKTDDLTVGSPERPTGFTIYDKATNQPVCIESVNGELTTTSGECGTQQTVVDNNDTDTEAPVLTLIGNNPAEIELGSEYSDLGITVTDNVNDNLGHTIEVNGDLVETVDLDTGTTTTYIIKYSATDEAGNIGFVERSVTVGEVQPIIEEEEKEEIVEETPDTIAPVISLIGLDSLTIEVGSEYIEEGATALDDVDGDISEQITITGVVDSSVAGDYIIQYNVLDGSLNEAVELVRTITVIEIEAENIATSTPEILE